MTTRLAETELLAPSPMLASDAINTARLSAADFDARYSDREWALEPKIDGWRAIVRTHGDAVQAWTRPRDGDPNPLSLPATLIAALKDLPDSIIDCEYVADIPNARSSDAARTGVPKKLVCFDLLTLLGESVMHLAYDERRRLLTIVVAHTSRPGVTVNPQLPVSYASVQALWDAGAEGAMLKYRSAPYTPGIRSAHWLKLKALEQHVVTIVGFSAGSSGPYSRIEIAFDDGTRSRVKALNGAWLRQFAADPQAFIGRKILIQCQLRGRDGKPRHPMAKKIFALDRAVEAVDLV